MRISDFGLANENIEISQTNGVGTLRFMAPELLAADENDDRRFRKQSKVQLEKCSHWNPSSFAKHNCEIYPWKS